MRCYAGILRRYIRVLNIAGGLHLVLLGTLMIPGGVDLPDVPA